MEKKNPYLLLIENCLGKLSLKYGTPFKYEITKKGISYSFTIYQADDPIFTKDVAVIENPEFIDYVHYEIVRDFFIGSIERIFMQIENAKKIFPKDHSKMKDKDFNITKGNW